ncbi:AAA family ATPase [Planctellipticum variicoloris]|nr:AAA family ATPase [Planctomycetaceae bacterium SH412]
MIDAEAGALFCNQCFGRKNGDGIAAVQWLLKVDFRTACELIDKYLHLPTTSGHGTNGMMPTHRTSSRKFCNGQVAVAEAEQRMGPATATWPYHDAGGREVGIVGRWETEGGKTIRQFSEQEDGEWTCSAMPEPRPLFRLPEVLKATGRIWICEGEKAADKLRQIGLTATTSSGGARAARRSDWSVLAGREVIIWPDHDQPGQKYADDVLQILEKLDPPPTVRRINPADLQLAKSEDAVDWIDRHDTQMLEELLNSLEAIADAAPAVMAPKRKFAIEFIDSAKFAAADYRAEFLVKRILVRGQPCILGGAQKTLKTSIAVDLALSLGTGTRFLGEFDVPHIVPVGILSGESGGFTLQETALRVAHARGWLLSDAKVQWGLRLPQLGLSEHLAALADAVERLDLKVLMIDPAYLCLLKRDDGTSISFSNVFEMGDVLGRFSEAFAGLDCTPIVVHHESKSATTYRKRTNFGPPDLSDLSMAGFAEWARQWLLLGRREEYGHGTGIHRLWLNAGGSAGHGGLWALDIDEGKLQDDFSGRKWQVAVSTPDTMRQAQKDATEARKANDAATRDDRDRQKLLDVYKKYPAGETARVLGAAARLNHSRFQQVNQILLHDGEVEPVRIKKKKTGEYDGFRLVRKTRGFGGSPLDGSES